MTSLRDTLGRLLKFSRQSRRPLALQAHKPIPIPTYIPRFEHTTSNYLRNRDPDHERNEAAKLKAEANKAFTCACPTSSLPHSLSQFPQHTLTLPSFDLA